MDGFERFSDRTVGEGKHRSLPCCEIWRDIITHLQSMTRLVVLMLSFSVIYTEGPLISAFQHLSIIYIGRVLFSSLSVLRNRLAENILKLPSPNTTLRLL